MYAKGVRALNSLAGPIASAEARETLKAIIAKSPASHPVDGHRGHAGAGSLVVMAAVKFSSTGNGLYADFRQLVAQPL